MPPFASDLVLPVIQAWATANSEKILAISHGGSWEGWAQSEIAYELTRAMTNIAAAESSDTMITVDRERPLWTDFGQGENRKRVDIFARFETGPDMPTHPFNAIELKCYLPKEHPEHFFNIRVPSDVAKFTTLTMEDIWYRSGCHLWVLALGVFFDFRELALPAGFERIDIPIANRYVLVVAVWRKTLDAGGVLGAFNAGYVAP